MALVVGGCSRLLPFGLYKNINIFLKLKFIPYCLKERTTIKLNARIFEVVALLELVTSLQRQQVVSAPPVKVLLSGNSECNLPFQILKQSLKSVSQRPAYINTNLEFEDLLRSFWCC